MLKNPMEAHLPVRERKKRGAARKSRFIADAKIAPVVWFKTRDAPCMPMTGS